MDLTNTTCAMFQILMLLPFLSTSVLGQSCIFGDGATSGLDFNLLLMITLFDTIVFFFHVYHFNTNKVKFFALCVFWFNLPTWMSNLLDTNNWKGLVFIFHLSGISNMWTIINYGIHVLYLSTAVVNIRWRFIAQACLYFFFWFDWIN